MNLRAHRLLRLGQSSIAFGVAGVVALHELNWQVFPRHVSTYAYLHSGWLWPLVLLAFAAGAWSLAAALGHGRPKSHWANAGRACLATAGALAVLLAVVPAGPAVLHPFSWLVLGAVHAAIAVACAVLATVALAAIHLAGVRRLAWRRVASPRLVLVPLMLLVSSWLLAEALRGAPAPLLQRAALLVLAGEWFLLARRARLAVPQSSPSGAGRLLMPGVPQGVPMGKKRGLALGSLVSDGRAALYLKLGLGGASFFAGGLLVLHVLNWGEMAAHGRHVSNFAHMSGSWLWQAGLIGLGLGTFALVEGLRRTVTVEGPAAWSFWALRAAGVAIVGMTVFTTDRYVTPDSNYSLAGYIHDACAVMSTFFICWAMLLMVAAARVDPSWLGVPGVSWLWPASTIALALAWMGGDVTSFWPIAAVVQRGVVILMVAWLLTTGWRALSAQALANGTPQPVQPPQPTR